MDFQRPKDLGDNPILDVLEEAARVRHSIEEENKGLRARLADDDAKVAADRKEEGMRVKRLEAAEKGLRGTQYILASDALGRRYHELEPYVDRRPDAEKYKMVSALLGATGGELIDQAAEIYRGGAEEATSE